MTFFKLVRRNLTRNWLRTLLTIGTTTFVLFLLAIMMTSLEAIQPSSTKEEATLRLISRHATSLTFWLPEAYEARIREIPGVIALSRSNWFGGYYKEQQNAFAQFAVRPKDMLDVYRDIKLTPEERQAFESERTACIMAPKLAQRFGWKLGDKVPLKSTIYPFTLDLTLRGIYQKAELEDFPALYFHWDYLNELAGRRGAVGTYDMRVATLEDLPRVSEAVDNMFANSDAPTKTETEQAFMAGFASMWGNVAAYVSFVGIAAVITIILVAANTMAMSARERVNEVAVMKTLGFPRSRILLLLLGESVGISLLGALLGPGTAKLVFDAFDLSNYILFIPFFRVSWTTVAICFAVSLVVGVVSGGIPAWRSATVNIVEGLRKVA